MIGWDADSGQWVPVDKEMMEGSFVGNVGRGAARGLEEIGQGISGLGTPADPVEIERRQLEAQDLEARQQEARTAAPWAEMIGEAAPDIAAGVATAPFAGGMSLPAAIGAEALTGGILGGLRPGSFDERLGRAAIGGALSIGGAALSVPATAGIGSALRLFRNVESQ